MSGKLFEQASRPSSCEHHDVHYSSPHNCNTRSVWDLILEPLRCFDRLAHVQRRRVSSTFPATRVAREQLAG